LKINRLRKMDYTKKRPEGEQNSAAGAASWLFALWAAFVLAAYLAGFVMPKLAGGA
jgi:hypothetical protein